MLNEKEELTFYVKNVLKQAVVSDGMGTCKRCGTYTDVREGICFGCTYKPCAHKYCPFREKVYDKFREDYGMRLVQYHAYQTNSDPKITRCTRPEGVCCGDERPRLVPQPGDLTVIQLNEVFYSPDARAEWCALPYPDHKQGCPNIADCIAKRPNFATYLTGHCRNTKEACFGESMACRMRPDVPEYPPMNKACFNYIPDWSWEAVIVSFDLKSFAAQLKAKHPEWSDRQCRCVLYWQNGVRKTLRLKAEYQASFKYGNVCCPETRQSVILDIPEACGVNIFVTMAKVGVILHRNPDIVHKIMLVGKKNA